MGDPILVTLMKLQPIIVKCDPIQRQIPISLLLGSIPPPWGPIRVLIRYIYMELEKVLVNDKITVFCQTNIISPKHCINR